MLCPRRCFTRPLHLLRAGARVADMRGVVPHLERAGMNSAAHEPRSDASAAAGNPVRFMIMCHAHTKTYVTQAPSVWFWSQHLLVSLSLPLAGPSAHRPLRWWYFTVPVHGMHGSNE